MGMKIGRFGLSGAASVFRIMAQVGLGYRPKRVKPKKTAEQMRDQNRRNGVGNPKHRRKT